MPRNVRFILALSLCLSAVPPAFGMDSIGEQFGNGPVSGLQVTEGQRALLNDWHRVYLYFIDSDGFRSYICGYFQGDTAGAQAALRRFAALDKGLDVVLLPGPRTVLSFNGKQKVSADWELHIPVRDHGRRFGDEAKPAAAGKPTLYLYVRLADPPAVPPAAPEQVARWLKALDADAFADRERAYAELEKQGVNVIAALRKALEKPPSAEARRRMAMLLGKLEGLPGVHLNILTIPDGVRVLGPEQQLTRIREDLKSENIRARAGVADQMTRFGPDPAALALLKQLLADKSPYPRQHAAQVLSKMEAAKDEPGAAERAARAKRVREEIGRIVKARSAKAKN